MKIGILKVPIPENWWQLILLIIGTFLVVSSVIIALTARMFEDSMSHIISFIIQEFIDIIKKTMEILGSYPTDQLIITWILLGLIIDWVSTSHIIDKKGMERGVRSCLVKCLIRSYGFKGWMLLEFSLFFGYYFLIDAYAPSYIFTFFIWSFMLKTLLIVPILLGLVWMVIENAQEIREIRKSESMNIIP